MPAKEFLNRARRLQARIDQLEDAKSEVWNRSTYSAKPVSKAPLDGKDVNRRTEAYSAYVDGIDAERSRLIEIKAEILSVVNQIPDNTLAALLTSYYINGKTWEQTAVELKYS